MRLLFIVAFLCVATFTDAQILNVESLRKVTDTSGWSGGASVNFSLRRNTKDFFAIYSDVHIQYKMKKHLVLFKNQVKFQKIEGDDFTNNGISHLRYNYKFRPRISFEMFGQAQYNKISKINFRGLLGMGPRFKLTTSENYKFYLGALIMYEYEEVEDGITPIQRDIRGSAYLSFSLYPNDKLTIISTTYFQPRLSSFNDYRISSQSSLLIDLFKNVAFKTSYTFTYDVSPAIGIPNSQYNLLTGLAYTFD